MFDGFLGLEGTLPKSMGFSGGAGTVKCYGFYTKMKAIVLNAIQLGPWGRRTVVPWGLNLGSNIMIYIYIYIYIVFFPGCCFIWFSFKYSKIA